METKTRRLHGLHSLGSLYIDKNLVRFKMKNQSPWLSFDRSVC